MIRALGRSRQPRNRLTVWGVVAALALVVSAPAGAAEEVVDDLDARGGQIAPTAAQRAMVAAMGARVTWNRYGTPHSLIRDGGFLATGIQARTAGAAARSWVEAHKALFRLDDLSSLATRNQKRLGKSRGHAILFRQHFDALRTVEDGTLNVGVVGGPAAGWKITYVSSTISGNATVTNAWRLSPREAWVRAAANVGHAVSLVEVGNVKRDGAWHVFGVSGLADLQRVRQVAVPTPSAGVRRAYETIFVQSDGALDRAYQHLIDADTGDVLVRKSIAEQSHPPVDTFTGAYTGPDGECDEDKGPWVVGATEDVRSIAVVAEAVLLTNDIVLTLLRDGELVASADTLFSPESLVYAPGGGVPAGSYTVQVCDFSDGEQWHAPQNYGGQIFFSAAGSPFPYPPRWKVFPGNPPLNTVLGFPWNNPSTDTRKVWCWESTTGNPADPTPVPGCQDEVGNLASRAPWDHDMRTNTPTFTTRGNNAHSREAWTSPLTPGATAFQPVSMDRRYVYPWGNTWFEQRCNPGSLRPGLEPDLPAAVTNLFGMHNRMHDWAYWLGFTERTWNAQDVNFGTGGTADGDPVLGDAQAGAISGGAPSFLGRDNANMIPLPDGVPPITNMYLWQPLAGAFYPPCVDGDFDMSVIAHEYGHLVENRMIGKGGLRSGHHAGAMGESTSDLGAVEILNEYGFITPDTANRFTVGPYVTGNDNRGIRNFAMSWRRFGGFPKPRVQLMINALNLGDIGYDITGPQVHADGEIWSATNYDLRTALVQKYAGEFPESDAALQRACAEGKRPAITCPGNRRWIQLVYDSFLLMAPDPSMLDARDAILAADMTRFSGANQEELWLAFARRGMGNNAYTTNGPGNPEEGAPGENDTDPKPGFVSPHHGVATVTFRAVSAETGAAIKARIYVGHYQARVSPIADTDPDTTAGAPGPNNLDAAAAFAPGVYDFVANAPGYGHLRLRDNLTAGNRTLTFSFPTNWASKAKGAVAAGDGDRHDHLIDDTEGTNWERIGAAPSVAGSQVTVDLGGGAHVVNRVQVSAMLLPGQSRFTGLRQFQVRTCDEGADLLNPTCAGVNPAGFTTVFTSARHAFPGDAPRPVSPALLLRSFDIPSEVPLADRTATHVQIRVLTNQCMGQTQFQGEQDNDPTNATDCRFGSSPNPGFPADPPDVLAPRNTEVRIAEFQVFSSGTGGTVIADPAALVTMTGPVTAKAGSEVSYRIAYTNLGPFAAQRARLVDVLPSGVSFVSASGGRFDAATRRVTWGLGTVNPGASGSRTLKIRVSSSAAVGSVIANTATFHAPKTVATPAAWSFVVVP